MSTEEKLRLEDDDQHEGQGKSQCRISRECLMKWGMLALLITLIAGISVGMTCAGFNLL
jgi:hypothetical protein